MATPIPEDFFALQVAFARRMAALAGQSLAESLLTMTGCYRMLEIAGDFEPAAPLWQGQLTCVDEDASEAEQTRAIHGYYLRRLSTITSEPSDLRHWGCFRFDWRPTQSALRLHFWNRDTREPGALSRQRMQARVAELRAMFAVARAEQSDAEWVIGASWLYNLDAYRRLFPPSYGASATPIEPETQFMALWGQFLRHDGSLNSERAEQFRARLATLDDPARMADCFPFQVMRTQAPIGDFYAFYGV